MGGRPDGPSRRLSKPMTNLSSSNLLAHSDQPLETSSPLAPYDRDYFDENATVVSSHGERRSRRKSRTKLREYLIGSSHESNHTPSSDDDDVAQQNPLAGAARGAKKRLSRTGSSIMQLSSAMASSTHITSPSTSKVALTLDPVEAAMVAQQIKEKAYYDSLAAQNHTAGPADEDKHVDAVKAPLRRKSLYTPGIATRHPSDILRKPPPPKSIDSQADRDYYYNPAYPESSPLAYLAALNVPDDGRSTPSNLHVTHLGGLQLGTLRVTNGTASPVPQNREVAMLRRSLSVDSNNQEDYQTASEGSVDGGKISQYLSATGRAHASNVSLLNAETPVRFENTKAREQQMDALTYARGRESFPFRQEASDQASAFANAYISEIASNPFSYEEHLPKESTASKDMFEDEAIALPQTQTPTIETWTELINDFEPRSTYRGSRQEAFEKLNGTVPSPVGSQRLSVPSSMTSRYGTSKDAISKIDSGYSSYASLHIGQARTTDDNKPHVSQERLSQSLPIRTRTVSGPREMHQSKLKKDSERLRRNSTKNQPSVPLIPPQALANSNPYASSTSVPETQEPDTRALETLPPIDLKVSPPKQAAPRKLQKVRPRSQPPPANLITVQGNREVTQAQIPRVPSLIATKHAERLRRFPALEHTFPTSQHVSARDSPAPSEIYRVPVRFPSPANALDLVTRHFSSSTVSEGEEQQSRSKDGSKYEENMVDEETERGRSAIVRSTSWSNFGFGKRKRSERQLVKQEKDNEKRLAKEEQELEKRLQKEKKTVEKQLMKEEKKRKSSSRASSRARGKSSERRPSQNEARPTIADFGTVTESLGGSPYDIATSISQSAPRDSTNRHPHQITTHRPRSFVGMNDVAATDFARLRSRDRAQSIGRPTPPAVDMTGSKDNISKRKPRPQSMVADAPPVPALSAVDVKAHDLDWARNRQRSRSFSGTPESQPESVIFTDRGGASAKSTPPRSINVDTPPVPSLPLSKHVIERKAQITPPRPQRIVTDSPRVPIPPTSNDPRSQEHVRIENPDILTVRKRRASSKVVPDLWSNGSLEKKSPPQPVHRSSVDVSTKSVTVEAEPQSRGDVISWEIQRQTWLNHRKSAGEVLLRSQWSKTSPNSDGSPSDRQASRSSVNLNVWKSRDSDSPTPSQRHVGPGSKHSPQASSPLALHQSPCSPRLVSQPDPQPKHDKAGSPPQPHQVPRKSIGLRTTRGAPPDPTPFQQIIGRYEGGLLYGYEPGVGIGGSAGTRAKETKASRKSVDVSRGYGVDLSDVPVFVCAVGK